MNDNVSIGVLEQVMWERDVALAQLAEIGKGLGAKMDDVRSVVRGQWRGEADGYADGNLVFDIWSCPCCGKYFDEWGEKPNWNFCPNCGADMREVDDAEQLSK